mgnify:CR=1 FL=1
MTKTSWLSAGLAAGLGCLLLAAAPLAAQEPEPPASVPRGTATTIAPTLPPPTGTLDVVRRRGVLRVGVSTFVPWVMNAKSGDLIGFEVDVAKRLADDLGVKAQFVQASFPNLLDDLLGRALVATLVGHAAAQVVDDHPGAAACQFERMRSAQAAAGSGDDGYASFQNSTHYSFL